MPREQINYPSALYESDPGQPSLADAKMIEPAAPSLHVSWLRDGAHVQVGIRWDRKLMLDAIREAPGDDDGNVTIWTQSLDRSELNRLVRATRRARDSSYGRDE